MVDVKISLLSNKYVSDELGNQILVSTEKHVYAKVLSASSSEFWKAGQTGLGADYKAVIWNFEYSGEGKVRFNDTVYEVYRTYVVGDKVELYLRKAIGTHKG